MTGMTRTLCTRSRRISDRDHLGDDEQEKQSSADDDGDRVGPGSDSPVAGDAPTRGVGGASAPGTAARGVLADVVPICAAVTGRLGIRPRAGPRAPSSAHPLPPVRWAAEALTVAPSRVTTSRIQRVRQVSTSPQGEAVTAPRVAHSQRVVVQTHLRRPPQGPRRQKQQAAPARARRP